MKTVLVECSPAQDRRDADKEGVGPDEDQGKEGGERGGQGELSVLGHHHVPLQGQHSQGQNRLNTLKKEPLQCHTETYII